METTTASVQIAAIRVGYLKETNDIRNSEISVNIELGYRVESIYYNNACLPSSLVKLQRCSY